MVFAFNPKLSAYDTAENEEVRLSNSELKIELEKAINKLNGKLSLLRKDDHEKRAIVKRQFLENLTDLQSKGLTGEDVYTVAYETVTDPALKLELEAQLNSLELGKISIAQATQNLSRAFAEEINKAPAWSSRAGSFEEVLIIVGAALLLIGLVALVNTGGSGHYYDDRFPDGTPCYYGEYYYDSYYNIRVNCGDRIYAY